MNCNVKFFSFTPTHNIYELPPRQSSVFTRLICWQLLVQKVDQNYKQNSILRSKKLEIS